MVIVNCQECKEQISDKAFICPIGFEWKSKQEFLGWPLVHIAVGFDKKTNRLAVARGIIAIG